MSALVQATLTCRLCMKEFHQIDLDRDHALSVVSKALASHVESDHPTEGETHG